MDTTLFLWMCGCLLGMVHITHCLIDTGQGNEGRNGLNSYRFEPSKECRELGGCWECLNDLHIMLYSNVPDVEEFSKGLLAYRFCKHAPQPDGNWDPEQEKLKLKALIETLLTAKWTANFEARDVMFHTVFLPMVAELMAEHEKIFPEDIEHSLFLHANYDTDPPGACESSEISSFMKAVLSIPDPDASNCSNNDGTISCLYMTDPVVQEICRNSKSVSPKRLLALKMELNSATFFSHSYMPELEWLWSKWSVTLWMNSSYQDAEYNISIPNVLELFLDFPSGWPTWPPNLPHKKAMNATLTPKAISQLGEDVLFSKGHDLSLAADDVVLDFRCVRTNAPVEEILAGHHCSSAMELGNGQPVLHCVCRGMGTYQVFRFPQQLNPTSTTTPVPIPSFPTTGSSAETDPPSASPIPTPTVSSTGPVVDPGSSAATTRVPRDASPTLIDVVGNYTEDSVEWITDTPGIVLDVIHDLTLEQNETGRPIPFDNVLVIVEIINNIVKTDPTLPPNMTATVDTVVGIYDGMLHWDIIEGTLGKPVDENEGQQAEQRLYEVLEKDLTIMLGNRREPFEFKKDLVTVNIMKVTMDDGHDFDSIKANGLKNTITVDAFESRSILESTYKYLPDGTVSSGLVADFRLNPTALKDEFDSANASGGFFTVTLSSLERFRYAPFDHSQIYHKNSKSRRVSPVMFIAKLSHPTTSKDAVVSYKSQTDYLFKTPEGGRYRGRRYYDCVYFDFNLTSEVGGWSNKECRAKTHTSWETGTTLECECDHLTPFTIFFYMCDTLIDLDEKERPSMTDQFLDLEPRIMTTISLSISISCITVVLLHTTWKLNRKFVRVTPLNFTRLNVVISLLVSNIAFLTAEYIPDHENANSCLATAIVSHWFMLSSFFWMSAETYFLLKIIAGKMEINFSSRDNFDGVRLRIALFGWGIPVLFPFISALSHIESASEAFGGNAYGSMTLWCWIDPQHHGFFVATFVLPVCLIALINLSAFAFYLYKRKEAEIESGQTRSVRQGSISVVGTCFLLGATWLSAYVMLMLCCDDTAKKVAGIFYILLNGLQGIFVLWVYVTRLDGGYRYIVNDVKKVTRLVFYRKGERSEFHSQSTRSETSLPSIKRPWHVGQELQAMPSAQTITSSADSWDENSTETDTDSGVAVDDGSSKSTLPLTFPGLKLNQVNFSLGKQEQRSLGFPSKKDL